MAPADLPKTAGPAPLTRREFLGTTACALAAAAFVYIFIIPSSALGKDGAVAPSNRMTVGVIGCGPQGRATCSTSWARRDCRVVAVCDVKTDQLGLARRAVNEFYGNEDCRHLPRLPGAPRPEGHRCVPDRNARPLAHRLADAGRRSIPARTST